MFGGLSFTGIRKANQDPVPVFGDEVKIPEQQSPKNIKVGFVANNLLQDNKKQTTPNELHLCFVPSNIPIEQFLDQYSGKGVFQNDEILLFWNSLSRNITKWKCLWNDPRINHIKKYTCKNIAKFNIQEIAYIAKAFAKMECKDANVIDQLGTIVKQYLDQKNSTSIDQNDIVNIAWAFQKFEYQNQKFIESLQAFLLKNLPNRSFSLDGQQLAALVFAISRLKGICIQLVNFLKELIRTKLSKDNVFSANDLINILALFAKHQCSDKTFLDELKKPIVENIRRQKFYSCSDLARISKYFAYLQYSDEELTRTLKSAIWRNLRRQNDFDNRDLINITASFALFNCRDWNFINDLDQVINSRLKEPKFFKTQDDVDTINQALERLKLVPYKPGIVVT